jgi:hypothetical protein
LSTISTTKKPKTSTLSASKARGEKGRDSKIGVRDQPIRSGQRCTELYSLFSVPCSLFPVLCSLFPASI